MKNTRTINVAKFILALMIVSSSLVVLQIKGESIFLLCQIIFCLLMFISTRKIVINKNIFLLFVVIEVVISTCLCIVSDIRWSYKKSALYMTILIIIAYFASAYVKYLLDNKYINYKFITTYVKIMCGIQLHWALAQFVLYKVLQFDINDFIFVKILKMVDSASVFKAGEGFMPSGFSGHPAILVPIVIIAFFMCESLYMKGMAILVAFICGNSTALISILLCMVLEFARISIPFLKKKKMNGFITLACIFIIVIGIIVAYRFGIIDIVIEKVENLYQRIFGLANDHGSGDAHRRYYTAYFDVLEISTFPQIIFGYGEGCSGYPYTILFNQYSTLDSWVTESDIMNIVLSRGFIGFVAYYGMLAYIAIRGYYLNYKYTFITLVMMIAGITYNVQFIWMFFINILLVLAVSDRIDIFKRTN